MANYSIYFDNVYAILQNCHYCKWQNIGQTNKPSSGHTECADDAQSRKIRYFKNCKKFYAALSTFYAEFYTGLNMGLKITLTLSMWKIKFDTDRSLPICHFRQMFCWLSFAQIKFLLNMPYVILYLIIGHSWSIFKIF